MISVRRMRQEDLAAVAKLEQQSFTVSWSEKLLEESLLSPLDRLWVLEEASSQPPERRIAAYCCFRVIAGEGELLRIAVLPEARGRGYGRRLMETLEESAAACGVGDITLEVRISNERAINLYKSRGFKAEAVRKRYYTNPTEDAVLMRRPPVEIITT